MFNKNITGCIETSTIAKFDHKLERGFIIQWVRMIFIKKVSQPIKISDKKIIYNVYFFQSFVLRNLQYLIHLFRSLIRIRCVISSKKKCISLVQNSKKLCHIILQRIPLFFFSFHKKVFFILKFQNKFCFKTRLYFSPVFNQLILFSYSLRD